ncbi:hypothetical protein [Promicromonospora umidemergens]|nr:hypothetical protein [Promicromonospora umidemergens]
MFSTAMVEAARLVLSGRPVLAITHSVVMVVASLVAAAGGFALGVQ